MLRHHLSRASRDPGRSALQAAPLRNLCVRRLPSLPRASRGLGRGAGACPELLRALDSSSLGLTLNFQLSTFNRVSFPSPSSPYLCALCALCGENSSSFRSCLMSRHSPLATNSFIIRTSETPLPQLLYNPHLRAPLGSAGNKGLITPLESALTKNSPVSLLESALTKRWGVGAMLRLGNSPLVTRHLQPDSSSFIFIHFQAPLHLPKTQPFCFHADPRSLRKTPGGGGCELQDGLDFGVQGDVGGGETVDREFRAAGFGKMKEAADVVVLVVSGEKALGFGRSQAKGGERDRLAKISGVGAVQTDKIAQGHHIILRPRSGRRILRPRSGGRSAARCFGAHGILLKQSVLREKREGKRPT